jgi:protein TonB
VLLVRTPRTTLIARGALGAAAAGVVALALLLLADTLVERPRARALEAVVSGRPLQEVLGEWAPPMEDPRGESPVPSDVWPPPPPPPPAPPTITGDAAGGAPQGVVGGVPEGVEGGVVGGALGGAPADRAADPPAPDVPATVMSRAAPAYPPIARAAGVEGTVIVEVEIDRTGAVTRATVLHSPSPLFDEAALDAARATRFRPATRDGIPVASTQPMTFSFRLN